MNTIQLYPVAGDASPFDRIKQHDDQGREFWSARDLMNLLGYEKWERFSDAVGRAMDGLRAFGMDPEREASRLREPFGKTRQMREDFRLSRYAAYLVAMECDARKGEVAQAKSYFAVRTREAETAPAMPVLSGPELMAAALIEAQATLDRSRAQIEEMKPKAEYVDAYVTDSDRVIIKQWGQKFGLRPTETFSLLLERKAIHRKSLGSRWSNKQGKKVEEFEYRPYADWAEFFDLVPQHNAPRLHNGQLRQTLYVKQARALDLASRLGINPFIIHEGVPA